MIIKDIQHAHNGITRTDGRYPQRIGSRVTFLYPPEPGTCMFLSYVEDNQGNPKDGYLRTSLITGLQEDAHEIVITTMNSRYIFTKESFTEHVSGIFD